jgi:hypothetical protein
MERNAQGPVGSEQAGQNAIRPLTLGAKSGNRGALLLSSGRSVLRTSGFAPAPCGGMRPQSASGMPIARRPEPLA